MGYKLDIWDDAKIEIFKGYNWYENKRVELGEEFINEVEKTLEYIEKHPEHYQIKYRNKYRESSIKKVSLYNYL